MKKYIKPEFTIEKLYIGNVITSSSSDINADIDGESTDFLEGWQQN